VKFTNLKILHLRQNPISLIPEYQEALLEELINLQYFDGLKVEQRKDEKEIPKNTLGLSQLEPLPDPKKPT